MKVYNSRFLEFSSLPADEQKLKNFKDLYVEISRGSRSDYVSLSSLFVEIKKDKDGNSVTRPVKSIKDFEENLSKNKVFETATGEHQLDSVTSTIVYESIDVPSKYDSTSIDKTGATDDEKVAQGLRRTLAVEQAAAGMGEYYYTIINGEGKFLRKEQIFWFDGYTKKTYLDAVAEGKDLSTITFRDEFDKEISAIYTEYEYKFSKVIAREDINVTGLKNPDTNLPAFTRETYTFDENGNVVYERNPLDKDFSDQQFVTQEVSDDKRPGKTKKVSKIKTTNYQIDLDGEYVSITVGKHTKMVSISNLVDENGNNFVDENGNIVLDISTMVGKKLKIKDGETVVAESEPLTFEQANITYSTMKTYKETESKPTKTTGLRLADGRYINELENVQPISFKLAPDDADEKDFDKYLVEQIATDGSKKYVVVDKTYFTKLGTTAGLNVANAKKLSRCDFNSKDCVVIQTTSKDEDIEQCAVVGKIDVAGVTLPMSDKSKKDHYTAFKSGYEAGGYVVHDVHIDGEMKELDGGGKRYEYTDVSYYDDHADNLRQYRTMRTKNITIDHGKIKGGAKFDIGRGIADSYSVWAKALVGAVTIAPAAGIFIPFLAPVVSAYCVGVLAAAPLIPVVNAGIGFVRNGVLRNIIGFKDKTEYNRNVEFKNCNQKIASLSKECDKWNENQFNDLYLNLMNDIAQFSQTTSNNSLVVVNGKAEVNPNNANLANEYIAEYKKAKRKFDSVDKKVKKLTAKGKAIPAELQTQYDDFKKQLDNLENTTRGQSYETDERITEMQNKAAGLKFYYNVKHLPDDKRDEFLAELGLDASIVDRIEFDAKLGLMLDGISVFADNKKIFKKFKNVEPDVNAWKSLRDIITGSLENLKVAKNKEPEHGCVEELTDLKEQIEAEYSKCLEVVNTIETTFVGVVDYEIKKSILLNKENTITAAESNYNKGMETTDVEVAKIQLSKLKEKHDTLDKLETSANDTKNLLVEILDEQLKFSQVWQTLVKKDETKKTLIEKVLDTTKQVAFSKELVDVFEDFNRLKKDTPNISNYANLLKRKEEFVRKHKHILRLYRDVNEELVNQDIKTLVKSIEIIVDKITAKFIELYTETKQGEKDFENNYATMKSTLYGNIKLLGKLKVDASNTKELSGARAIKEKVVAIEHITRTGCEALAAAKKVNKTHKSVFHVANEYIHQIENFLKVDEKEEIAALNTKCEEADKIYQCIRALIGAEKRVGLNPKGKPFDIVRFDGEIQIRDALKIALGDKTKWTDQTKELLANLECTSGLSGDALKKKIAELYSKLEANIAMTQNTIPKKGSVSYNLLQASATCVCGKLLTDVSADDVS